MRRLRSILIMTAVFITAFSALPTAAVAQTPVRDNRDIIITGTDSFGKSGPMRRGYWNGVSGTGADKILNKHKINNFSLFTGALRAVDRFQEAVNGTTFVYRLPVGIVHCEDTYAGLLPKSDCSVDEERRDTIRLVMDYRQVEDMPTDDKTYGVVSMYCTKTGDAACPNWINDVANYPAQGAYPF